MCLVNSQNGVMPHSDGLIVNLELTMFWNFGCLPDLSLNSPDSVPINNPQKKILLNG